VADESHLVPANTLQRVCSQLMALAPYRFFVSATQLRTDGLDLVLEGITGPIVYRKPLRELVDAGYLARPAFKMVRVKTQATLNVPDANRMTQEHLYYSPVVNRVAGDLVNQFVEVMRRPVLVLVDELEQFRHLAPHIRYEARFAHGPLTAETKKLVPEAHHDCDVTKLVEDFNAGEYPVLVGTSCVATGTDLKAPEAVIYLMGGVSEIKVAQAVGRGTRGGANGTPVLNPWTGEQKRDCVFVDFQVEDDVEDLDGFAPYRHAQLRAATYEQLYAPPDYVDMTGGNSLG
jgi:superfamily II DNA or RNA helicase